MTASPQHTHDLDEKLHEDCAACDRIRALRAPARDAGRKQVENMLDKHMAKAAKAPPLR